MKEKWNFELKNTDDECFSHLFYYPQSGEKGLFFKRSIKCKWSELKLKIKNVLAEERLGQFGPSVMIKSSNDEELNLKDLDSYFSSEDTFSKARKVMIIIFSSYDQGNN